MVFREVMIRAAALGRDQLEDLFIVERRCPGGAGRACL